MAIGREGIATSAAATKDAINFGVFGFALRTRGGAASNAQKGIANCGPVGPPCGSARARRF
jgi:hypothetical protein